MFTHHRKSVNVIAHSNINNGVIHLRHTSNNIHHTVTNCKYKCENNQNTFTNYHNPITNIHIIEQTITPISHAVLQYMAKAQHTQSHTLPCQIKQCQHKLTCSQHKVEKPTLPNIHTRDHTFIRMSYNNHNMYLTSQTVITNLITRHSRNFTKFMPTVRNAETVKVNVHNVITFIDIQHTLTNLYHSISTSTDK